MDPRLREDDYVGAMGVELKTGARATEGLNWHSSKIKVILDLIGSRAKRYT